MADPDVGDVTGEIKNAQDSLESALGCCNDLAAEITDLAAARDAADAEVLELHGISARLEEERDELKERVAELEAQIVLAQKEGPL